MRYGTFRRTGFGTTIVGEAGMGRTCSTCRSKRLSICLKINVGAYLIESDNARHEHEVAVWERVKLPDGKVLVPGVVSHATPVIEHPELVAYRIRRFVQLVGADNVIAGADCGFGGRVHPQIGWAKLNVLVEGAALASKQSSGA